MERSCIVCFTDPTPPENLTALVIDNGIAVKWEIPPDCDDNEVEVHVTEERDHSPVDNNPVLLPAGSSSYTIDSRALTTRTLYCIGVRCLGIPDPTGEEKSTPSDMAKISITFAQSKNCLWMVSRVCVCVSCKDTPPYKGVDALP